MSMMSKILDFEKKGSMKHAFLREGMVGYRMQQVHLKVTEEIQHKF